MSEYCLPLENGAPLACLPDSGPPRLAHPLIPTCQRPRLLQRAKRGRRWQKNVQSSSFVISPLDDGATMVREDSRDPSPLVMQMDDHRIALLSQLFYCL